MLDYLIVGSGLFGSVFAYEAKKLGKKVQVVEKRHHIGGNIYTKVEDNINLHLYGAHIFHTSKINIWNYINQFATFNNYINSPIANYKGQLFNLPFNMNTFYQMWKVTTPTEAKEIIEKQKAEAQITSITNLEEQAISLIGKDIYLKLIKGYTEKQWGTDAKSLPPEIIRRLPVRFTFDNNYFNDRYQGIPEGGYTKIIEQLLEGIPVALDTDYLKNKDLFKAKKVLYTGSLDSYFDYCFGDLDFRSVYFENERLEQDNYQGVAVMNYTDRETPYTRIIEHKHFEKANSEVTWISKEYSVDYKETGEPYYPINNAKNQEHYKKYQELAAKEKNLLIGGRLANYAYYDMDKTIEAALDLVNRELIQK